MLAETGSMRAGIEEGCSPSPASGGWEMRMRVVLMVVGLALLIGWGVTARADEPADAGKGPPGWRARIMDRFDKDGDGTLNEAERAAVREAVQERFPRLYARVLERFDKDEDGKLNEAERAALRQATRRCLGRLRRRLLTARRHIVQEFDQDGDHRLNDDERAAAREAVKARIREWMKNRAARRKAVMGEGDL